MTDITDDIDFWRSFRKNHPEAKPDDEAYQYGFGDGKTDVKLRSVVEIYFPKSWGEGYDAGHRAGRAAPVTFTPKEWETFSVALLEVMNGEVARENLRDFLEDAVLKLTYGEPEPAKGPNSEK
jgi:hypothetical protein